MADLFKDIIPSILQNKNYVLDNEKDYHAFVINKALSFHYDAILQANMMNLFPNLPGTMQYHYLLNTVRGYKRPFRKWEKREEILDLELVKEYYNYSNEKAKDVLNLLTDEQLADIKSRLNKGGVQKQGK